MRFLVHELKNYDPKNTVLLGYIEAKSLKAAAKKLRGEIRESDDHIIIWGTLNHMYLRLTPIDEIKEVTIDDLEQRLRCRIIIKNS